MSSIKSELNRVPASMQHIHQKQAMYQQLLNGSIQLTNINSDSVPEPEIQDVEVNMQPSITKDLTIENSDSHHIATSFVDTHITPGLDLRQIETLLNNWGNKFLGSLKSATEQKEQAKQTYAQERATLKIDVLSYSFNYIKCYKSDAITVFVLKEPFSLEITDPVKFKLSTDDDQFINNAVICLGAPIELPEFNISLLLFASDI
jgi:hypothetical protein